MPFFHGDLEVLVYMEQPPGFKNTSQPTYVYCHRQVILWSQTITS